MSIGRCKAILSRIATATSGVLVSSTCCAMLMALLFVFGVMNLAWVAILAVAVLIEKAVPGGQQIAWLAGIAAVAVGVAMVLGLSPMALKSRRMSAPECLGPVALRVEVESIALGRSLSAVS
jgi:Predicted metal-binding integral membrane protein (DUF2182)